MFRKDIPIIPRYGSELNSYTLLVLHFMAFFINIIIIGMTMKIASDFLSLAQTAPRAIVGLIVFVSLRDPFFHSFLICDVHYRALSAFYAF